MHIPLCRIWSNAQDQLENLSSQKICDALAEASALQPTVKILSEVDVHSLACEVVTKQYKMLIPQLVASMTKGYKSHVLEELGISDQQALIAALCPLFQFVNEMLNKLFSDAILRHIALIEVQPVCNLVSTKVLNDKLDELERTIRRLQGTNAQSGSLETFVVENVISLVKKSLGPEEQKDTKHKILKYWHEAFLPYLQDTTTREILSVCDTMFSIEGSSTFLIQLKMILQNKVFKDKRTYAPGQDTLNKEEVLKKCVQQLEEIDLSP
jgi:hypothetical protein